LIVVENGHAIKHGQIIDNMHR